MLTFFHPEAVKKFLHNNNIGNVQHTLAYLEKLGEAFQRIPYENLTKLIKCHSVSDPDARLRLPELLYEEFLRYGTGGTCFSMTYFLQTILKFCGFDAYPVMADRPLAPDTHCLSIIIMEGKKYIMDPGFMIGKPLPLTEIPTRHNLSHNNIIIGARDAVQIPGHQMKYFRDLSRKKDDEIILPYEKILCNTKEYAIATFLLSKIDIRYFLKDEPVDGKKFLEFWQDSFNWPTLHNISITTVVEKGYIYARNNFLRKTTAEGRDQTRIKKDLESTLGKTFHIDQRIIKNAFEVLELAKRKIENRREG